MGIFITLKQSQYLKKNNEIAAKDANAKQTVGMVLEKQMKKIYIFQSTKRNTQPFIRITIFTYL